LIEKDIVKMHKLHLTEMRWSCMKNTKPKKVKIICNSYITRKKGNRKTK